MAFTSEPDAGQDLGAVAPRHPLFFVEPSGQLGNALTLQVACTEGWVQPGNPTTVRRDLREANDARWQRIPETDLSGIQANCLPSGGARVIPNGLKLLVRDEAELLELERDRQVGALEGVRELQQGFACGMLCGKAGFLVFLPGEVRLRGAAFGNVLVAPFFRAELVLFGPGKLLIRQLLRKGKQGADDIRSMGQRACWQQFPGLRMNSICEQFDLMA